MQAGEILFHYNNRLHVWERGSVLRNVLVTTLFRLFNFSYWQQALKLTFIVYSYKHAISILFTRTVIESTLLGWNICKKQFSLLFSNTERHSQISWLTETCETSCDTETTYICSVIPSNSVKTCANGCSLPVGSDSVHSYFLVHTTPRQFTWRCDCSSRYLRKGGKFILLQFCFTLQISMKIIATHNLSLIHI